MREIWVSIMGLTRYLWSLHNAETLGNTRGQGLIEADKDYIEMVILDLFWIRIRMKEILRGWWYMWYRDLSHFGNASGFIRI